MVSKGQNSQFKTAQFAARAAKSLHSQSLWHLAMVRLKHSIDGIEVVNG